MSTHEALSSHGHAEITKTRIPYTTTPSGQTVQDWDTAAAIDIPFLAQSLSYVRKNGHLPPRLQSKEDQNEETDSGVPHQTIEELRNLVERQLQRMAGSGDGENQEQIQRRLRTIAFMEGFLLYSPPRSMTSPAKGHDTTTGEGNDAPLRTVHDQIQLPLFLPASYQNVKARREGRSGYVTLGPAPEPPTATSAEAGSSVATKSESSINKNQTEKKEQEIDLDKEDDRPPQNFWVDPPGYVDDVVWPRYVEDHAWLLLPQDAQEQILDLGEGREMAEDRRKMLLERVGDGRSVREDVGVRVAPGFGEMGMEMVVRWAVDEILRVICQES